MELLTGLLPGQRRRLNVDVVGEGVIGDHGVVVRSPDGDLVRQYQIGVGGGHVLLGQKVGVDQALSVPLVHQAHEIPIVIGGGVKFQGAVDEPEGPGARS